MYKGSCSAAVGLVDWEVAIEQHPCCTDCNDWTVNKRLRTIWDFVESLIMYPDLEAS
jgi:hypothetical protein